MEDDLLDKNPSHVYLDQQCAGENYSALFPKMMNLETPVVDSEERETSRSLDVKEEEKDKKNSLSGDKWRFKPAIEMLKEDILHIVGVLKGGRKDEFSVTEPHSLAVKKVCIFPWGDIVSSEEKGLLVDSIKRGTEVFFVGNGINASDALISFINGLSCYHVNVTQNQIKLILFNVFDYSDPKEVSQLHQILGRANVLNFRNQTWGEIGLGLISSRKKDIGISIVTGRFLKKSVTLLPTIEVIESSFSYAQENYGMSPDTDLGIIGVPPLLSFSGRGYSSAIKTSEKRPIPNTELVSTHNPEDSLSACILM